jgi:hypothetical protein
MTRDGDLALLEKALGGGDQTGHRQRHLYERDLLVALGPQKQDEVVSEPACQGTDRCRISRLRICIHFIRIRIKHFRLNTHPDPIWIQGFNDQKLKKKITSENFFFFGDQKLQFTYLSLGLIKNVQVTEEAFRSQKRPSNT